MMQNLQIKKWRAFNFKTTHFGFKKASQAYFTPMKFSCFEKRCNLILSIQCIQWKVLYATWQSNEHTGEKRAPNNHTQIPLASFHVVFFPQHRRVSCVTTSSAQSSITIYKLKNCRQNTFFFFFFYKLMFEINWATFMIFVVLSYTLDCLFVSPYRQSLFYYS